MSDVVISVEGLGKKYRLGANAGPSYKTVRESLVDAGKGPMRKLARVAGRKPADGERGHRPEFWALKDVNFEVKRGEVLGIIGRNGAGKSTLLKILSQITEPTEGEVRMKGRVASLLEVGTGFHPELTGRENVYLNGAILGMGKGEIARKFDEIVDFAEVEKFIDTPVKHYSSGMYLRLAFSVAAHLEPEILIVDEVLAVGDATFQKRCLGKMGDVAGEGRTVLLVSHQIAAIRQLCHYSLWLEAGTLAARGRVEEVVGSYLLKGTASAGERVWTPGNAPGSDCVRLRAVRVVPDGGGMSGTVQNAVPFSIEVDYDVLQRTRPFRVVIWLYRSDGTLIFASLDTEDKRWRDVPREPGSYSSTAEVPAHLLNEGCHLLSVTCDTPLIQIHFKEDSVISFEVERTEHTDTQFIDGWQGAIAPQLRWRIQRREGCLAADPIAYR